MNKNIKSKLYSLRYKLLAIGAPTVAVIVAAVILLTAGSGLVEAAVSLPNIEAIANRLRTTNSTFTILEIAGPSGGSFGYYVDGQEPGIAGEWEDIVGNISGRDNRADYVNNNLRGALQAAGYISTTPDELPLTWLTEPSEYYTEVYPWEDRTGLRELRLENEEIEYDVPGYMNEVAPGEGQYNAKYDFLPLYPYDGLDNLFMLPVHRVEHCDPLLAPLDPNIPYYANPVWAKIRVYDENDPGVPQEVVDGGTGYYYEASYITGLAELYKLEDLNTALYDYVSTLDPTDPTYPGAPEDHIYVFDRVASEGMDITEELYVIIDYGMLSPVYDPDPAVNAVYAVTSYSNFVPAPLVPVPVADPLITSDLIPLGARFTRSIEYYTYIGDTGGLYEFTPYDPAFPEDPIPTVQIRYSTVFYESGFVNNNWFLRHVFDRDIDELPDYAGKVIVRAVTADGIDLRTGEPVNLDALIAGADMIVLNGDIPAISDETAAAIFNAATSIALKPIMFDYALSSAPDATLRGLVQDIVEQKAPGAGLLSGPLSANGVIENVFWTSRHINELRAPYGDTSMFTAVAEEIDYENFLRVQQGMGDDLLSTVITNATAIRYIINYAGQRVMHVQPKINVLELQGGLIYPGFSGITPPSGSPDYARRGTLYSSDLTEAKVREWIGDTPPYKYSLADGTMTITRMTTYEFNGKLEDLNEEYHMIYIGGTARGMNDQLVSGNYESRYNDSTMNGLVYTNIGDTYQVNTTGDRGAALSGHVSGDNNRRFRLSGNDISRNKMNDILEFAEAGYPVIVDNRLIIGEISGGGSGDYSFTPIVTFVRPTTVSGNSGEAVYRVQLDGTQPPGATYQWYIISPNAPYTAYPITPSNNPAADGYFDFTFRHAPAGQSNLPQSMVNQGLHYIYCDITFDGETQSIFKRTGSSYPGGVGSVISLYRNGTNYRIGENGMYGEDWTGDPVELHGNVGSVDWKRVDSSSYMYQTLNSLINDEGISSFGNIFTANAAAENSSLVARYLNLSKPEVIMSESDKPVKYEKLPEGMTSIDVAAIGKTFYFTFSIDNPAEAAPQTTTYDVELFLDINGDGRYTADEKQNDIVVRLGGAAGAVLSQDNLGARSVYQLRAVDNSGNQIRYHVTKQMPQSAVGLYDWCLRITKNHFNSDGTYNAGKRNVRASQSGLTRIESDERTTIHILQIASSLIPTSSSHPHSYKDAQQRANFEWQQRTLTSDARINETIAAGLTSTTDAAAANRYLVEEGYSTSSTTRHTGPGHCADCDRMGRAATYYEGIYGKLIADVEDFDIKIYTVYADEVSSVSTLQSRINSRPDGMRTNVGEYLAMRNLATEIPPAGSGNYNLSGTLTDIFGAFDMLIVGFDDSYGTLNAAAANAIVDNIKGVKKQPALFAHDTVTYYANTSHANSYGVESAFILRDALALDRYGLSTPDFNTQLRNGVSLPAAITQALTDNNYSVAWTPGLAPESRRTTTLPQVQGLSSHVLKWFGYQPDSAGVDNVYDTFMGTTRGEDTWNASGTVQRVTDRVSQLNKGKITEYPYNVNIEAGNPNIPSGSPAGTAYVGLTHGQWYTVNMNLDDIAVWYCLSSNNYINNDAANAYYIYNTGNITYTGAGHSMDQGVTTGRNTSRGGVNPQTGASNNFSTNPFSYYSGGGWQLTTGIEFEAKLFVNTMIAAYRAANAPPIVQVTNSIGTPVTFHFVPADGGVLEGVDITSTHSLYFNFEDGNLSPGKRISLNLSYRAGDELDPEEDVNTPLSNVVPYPPAYMHSYETGVTGIYNYNDGALANLQSGVPYRFRIPQEVLDLFANPDIHAVRLRLEVVTDVGGTQYKGYKDIVIRKVDLFPLT